MPKGDILLITFPFTDLSGNKLRPAVVLIDSGIDLTVSFITSQTHWQDANDVLLVPNPINGLKKQSLIRTGKIATLDKILVKGLLGRLGPSEVKDLDKNLKALLQIN